MVEHGPHGDVGPPVHGADGMHVVAVAVSGAERVQRPPVQRNLSMRGCAVVEHAPHADVRSPVHGADDVHVDTVAVGGAKRVQRSRMHSTSNVPCRSVDKGRWYRDCRHRLPRLHDV